MPALSKIRVIDSHTGGEPTRVIVSGGPDLGMGPLAQRVKVFQDRYDTLRSAVVNEPRGSDAMVGALLCQPFEPDCVAGVIFFNNVGYLGMCGHGTIGLVATLAHLGRISPGEHGIDTPCGVVKAVLHDSGAVSVRNVPSYRHAAAVDVDVPGIGTVQGDVAWGGNWFFLINHHPMELALCKIEELTAYTWAVRQALAQNGITGAGGAEIDHIELFGPSAIPGVHSKNFVLCPGKAYDRSPCGTGTSAKLACLYADQKLAPGEVWRQESIVGSVFEGSIEVENGDIYPTIRGAAFVNGDAELILDERDPFCMGIRR